jgi:hypothetical protein
LQAPVADVSYSALGFERAAEEADSEGLHAVPLLLSASYNFLLLLFFMNMLFLMRLKRYLISLLKITTVPISDITA